MIVSEKILFLTGKLAKRQLERILNSMKPEFSYQINQKLTVMTNKIGNETYYQACVDLYNFIHNDSKLIHVKYIKYVTLYSNILHYIQINYIILKYITYSLHGKK